MKTLKEKIEVMQAAEDGKSIEFYSSKDDSGWIVDPSPDWNWLAFDYRIKPEPRVFYAVDTGEEILQIKPDIAGEFIHGANQKIIKLQEVIE